MGGGIYNIQALKRAGDLDPIEISETSYTTDLSSMPLNFIRYQTRIKLGEVAIIPSGLLSFAEILPDQFLQRRTAFQE